MEKQNNNIILRQISDHIFQSINRIRDDIEYIIFLRQNTKMEEISTDFYIKQIDRFSRDVLITFGHILDNDSTANTLQSLINEINNKKYEKRLAEIRIKTEYLKKHRNKIVAHHDTSYNSQFGDYYPAQPFNYLYPLDPCFSMEILESVDELMGDIFEKLKIDGIGCITFQQTDLKNIFREDILGKADNSRITLEFEHECHAKKCLLK